MRSYIDIYRFQSVVVLNQSQSGIYVDTGLGSAANTVIPANAGIQGPAQNVLSWTPAYAGVTKVFALSGCTIYHSADCRSRLWSLAQCSFPLGISLGRCMPEVYPTVELQQGNDYIWLRICLVTPSEVRVWLNPRLPTRACPRGGKGSILEPKKLGCMFFNGQFPGVDAQLAVRRPNPVLAKAVLNQPQSQGTGRAFRLRYAAVPPLRGS